MKLTYRYILLALIAMTAHARGADAQVRLTSEDSSAILQVCRDYLSGVSTLMRAGGDTAEENVVSPIDFIQGDQSSLWSTRYHGTPDKSLKSLYRMDSHAFDGSTYWRLKVSVIENSKYPTVLATLMGHAHKYTIRFYLNHEDSSWLLRSRSNPHPPHIVFSPSWKLIAPWDVLTEAWIRDTVDGDTVIYSPKERLGDSFFQMRRRTRDTVMNVLGVTRPTRLDEPFYFKEIIASGPEELAKLLGCVDFPAYSDGLSLPPMFISSGPAGEPYELTRILVRTNPSVPRIILEGFSRLIENNPIVIDKLLESLRSYYRDVEAIRFEENLLCLSGYSVDIPCKDRAAGAGYLLCKLTYRKLGIEGVRTLILQGGGMRWIVSDQNKYLVKTINEVLGLGGELLDRALWEELMNEETVRRSRSPMR